jgi:RNA polymerase sigma-70 factor (ECF subfamily)
VDLSQIYDAHAPALFAFVLNLTRDEADTRDVLQEIFHQLARSPTLLVGARDPRAFLLRLAHNRAIDLIRRRTARQRRHEQVMESVAMFSTSADPDTQTFRQALATALGQIPEDQRAVVHLKLWEDLTFDQIADLLGIPPNTAASRYRYGLDKLRDQLRPIYEEIKNHGRV